jgi:hypothetical protein
LCTGSEIAAVGARAIMAKATIIALGDRRWNFIVPPEFDEG